MRTEVDKGLEEGHESSGDLRPGSGLVLVRFCVWLEQMISPKCIKEVHPSLYNWLRFIPFYGWVVFHCMYVLHLLYPFICQWTFRLLPWPGYCQQSSGHWGACISSNYGFLWTWVSVSKNCMRQGSGTQSLLFLLFSATEQRDNQQTAVLKLHSLGFLFEVSAGHSEESEAENGKELGKKTFKDIGWKNV